MLNEFLIRDVYYKIIEGITFKIGISLIFKVVSQFLKWLRLRYFSKLVQGNTFKS